MDETKSIESTHTYDQNSSSQTIQVDNVPGFTLGELIGKGGMGDVYRAVDNEMNREVAVKILQDRYPVDSASALRFLEEAKITGQLQHPGIPAVHRVSKLPDGRPFLAMKLIKGHTLEELIKQKVSINPMALMEQIAQALGYAHAHGVIHRDIKPSNVMVGRFGEVQLLDWGLSKVMTPPRAEQQSGSHSKPIPDESVFHSDRDSSQTQAGSVLGTPAYMSPEQAAGEIDRVGPASDVFGLGAMWCKLLTGQPPFTGADTESVRRNAMRGKTEDALARLDACGAEPEVLQLIRQCLRFDPADRPKDANVVAQRVATLRIAAEDRAKQAALEKARSEVSMIEQGKRRRTQLWAAAVISTLFVIGLIMLLYQSNLEEQTRLKEALLESERESFRSKEYASNLQADLLRQSQLKNEAIATYFTILLHLGQEDKKTGKSIKYTDDINKVIQDLQRYREQGENENDLSTSFYLGLACITAAEARLNSPSKKDWEEALVLVNRAELEFRFITTKGPETIFAKLVSSNDVSKDGGYRFLLDLAKYAALMRLGRSSEALVSFDAAYPRIRASTPPLKLTEVVEITDLPLRMMKLIQEITDNMRNRQTSDDTLRDKRNLLLRAAEMEQSRLPWSRGAKADQQKAMQQAAYLAESPGVAAPAIYNSACAFAVASDEKGIPASEKERRAAKAMAYLLQLEQGGYFTGHPSAQKHRKDFLNDKDFDAIRSREDFRTLSMKLTTAK